MVTHSLTKRPVRPQVASNAFRIMTSVYKCRESRLVQAHTSTSEALCVGMRHSAAKVRPWLLILMIAKTSLLTSLPIQVRWNACIATSAFLGAASVGDPPTSATQSMIKTLIDRLALDSSFKVRIHAANALIAASSSASHKQELVQVCRTTLEQLEAQLSKYEIANRERAHAEVLVKRVRPFAALALLSLDRGR